VRGLCFLGACASAQLTASGAPELPEGAVAHSDFVAGYHYAGGAARAVADVISAPERVTGAGLPFVYDDPAVAMIGALGDAVKTVSWTILIKFTNQIADGTAPWVPYILGLSNEDDSSELGLKILPNSPGNPATTYQVALGEYNDTDSRSCGGGAFPAGETWVALTRTDTHFAVSTNGESAFTDSDPASLSLGSVAYFAGFGSYEPFGTSPIPFTVKSITVYPPQDDADLPALSALS